MYGHASSLIITGPETRLGDMVRFSYALELKEESLFSGQKQSEHIGLHRRPQHMSVSLTNQGLLLPCIMEN